MAASYAVLGLLVAAALSRSPYIFAHGRFWAEEGSLHFRHMVVDPFPEDILYVQNATGYYNFVTNLLTWLADQVPLRQAPLVTSWLSLAVIIALAWIVLAWPSELLPTAAARIAAATLLVVGTLATPDVWANSINLPPYLGLLTLVLLFVETRRIGRIRFGFGAGMLGIASITGIYSTVFAPLFLLRAYQERTLRRALYAGILSIGACIQFVLVMQNRASGDLADSKMRFPGWGEVATESAGRHVLAFLVSRERVLARLRHASDTRLIAYVLLGLAVCAFLAVLLAKVPNRRVALMLGTAFVLTELLVAYGALDGGGRYSVVPIGILILALVHGATAARGQLLPLGATVLCAVVLVSGLSTFWTYDRTRLRCIGCPVWTDEVREWEARETGKLEIWPYPGWVVQLPVRADKPEAGKATAR
jgi:hypothetical protein